VFFRYLRAIIGDERFTASNRTTETGIEV